MNVKALHLRELRQRNINWAARHLWRWLNDCGDGCMQVDMDTNLPEFLAAVTRLRVGDVLHIGGFQLFVQCIQMEQRPDANHEGTWHVRIDFTNLLYRRPYLRPPARLWGL